MLAGATASRFGRHPPTTRRSDRDRTLEGTQAPGTGIQSPYNEDTFGLDWSFYAQRGETPHLLGVARYSLFNRTTTGMR